jgi:hypothetical protein
MPDYDAGFKIVARQAGRELSEVAGIQSDALEPIGDTVQATERLADRAFRGRLGRERFLVYMEAYTRWQSSAPWSILAKSGLLSERERLPALSVVFILQPRGYRPQGGEFRLEAAGGPTQHIWFREVCLWQQQPQVWWEDSPGLMALYPLCRHGRPRVDAVMHAAQRIGACARDSVVRADLLTTLSIFGKLVYPDLDVIQLIGREQMRESKFFEEVMAEGALERARIDVLEAIDVRFGSKAAAELKGAVQSIADPVELSQVLRMVIKSRLPQVRRALTVAGSTT